MSGDLLVPVLMTFLIVNVILIVRAGARRQLRRPGAAAAGRPQEPQLADGSAAPDPTGGGLALMSAASDPSDPSEVRPPLARADRDMLTGLDDKLTWDRRIADESARVKRYPRPVTIVRLELDGLERLTGLLGEEAGDLLLRAIADTLRRLARDTDHIAYLGHGGFGVLMPETPDEAAVGYVERVSRACELWLESAATSVRLAIGWAATSGGNDLAEVQQLATERMHGGQWRDTRRAGTVAGPAPAASDARRPTVTEVPSAATPSLDWDRCRDPNCDHKKDHRRDRQR